MMMLYGVARGLALILLGLAALVMPEIVKDARRVTIGMQDTQHRYALRVRDFLRVPRIGHRLVLIVLELNVSQLHVRNILHVYPTDAKLTLPLVLRPDTTVALIIDGRYHLRHAAKVTGSVDGKEQIKGRTLATRFSISLIQSFVAVFRAAPDFILDGPVYVVLRVRLDYEEPGTRRGLIKLYGIIIILHFQFVENRMRRVDLGKLLLLLLMRLRLLLL